MIELKKEYTILLCHVLSPIILEGLQSIYDRAKNGSQKNNVLKTFQLFLKAIPGWDIEIIRKEVERIMSKTKEQPWLVNLIQTIFRFTILLNNIEPSEELKKELDMGYFIHSIYIECARQFWMDPFLFYHDCSSLEQKKNYNEILKIICCCIENAIRRVLPLSAICEKLLGEKANLKTLNITQMYNVQLILNNTPMTLKGGAEVKEKPQIEESKLNMIGGNDEDFKNNIQMVPTNQMMSNMMQQNMLPNMHQNMVPNMQPNMQPNMHQNMVPNMQPTMQPNMQPTMQPNMVPMTGGTDINEKILNIINKNNVLSDSHENNNNFTVNNHSANNQMIGGNEIVQNKHHSDRKSSSTLKRIIHESIKQSHHSATKSHNSSELKNKILKDLDSDTVQYNPEDNLNNYQDIFSNSDVKHTVNTHEKAEKKSREKFFNNYLNI